MSKYLFVMRHAKSSWNHPGLSDHDRPLNKRGLRDSPLMAQFMNRQKLAPSLILSSSAHRAKTTAELFQSHLEAPAQWEIVEDFYLAPPEIYLQHVMRIPDEISQVILIGHNPGLETLVEQLAGETHRMPTAAIAGFHTQIASWSSLPTETSSMKFLGVWRPKEIQMDP